MGPSIHACSSSKAKEVLCWDGNIESILALVNLSEVRINLGHSVKFIHIIVEGDKPQNLCIDCECLQ